MKNNNLLARYDKHLRIHMHYPEARKEVTSDVVRFVRKSPGMNFVSFTFANEQNLERVIDQQVDYFLPMEQPFTWKVYDHDLLPSLKDKLATRGFAGDDDPAAVMVMRVKKAPASLFAPLTTLALAGSARVVPGATLAPARSAGERSGKKDIRRITDLEGLKDVIHVLDKVYGGHNTWVNDRLGRHLQVSGYLSVYVAYVENQPVSIAWTHFPRGQFASLFAGTTIAEYRKQGLYTSLIAARLQEIRERGFAYAVVEAGKMSKPILARHGFQHLTTVHDYEWKGN